MSAAKTYTVELHRWPDGSYGLPIIEDVGSSGLDPIAVFEVRTTAKSKIATQVIAHLLGVDTSHAVWRVR